MGAFSDEVRFTAPGFSMIAELFPVPSARARLTATCVTAGATDGAKLHM